MAVLAPVVYEADGRRFVRLPDLGGAVNIVDAHNGRRLRDFAGVALTQKSLERLIAEKRIRRRLDVRGGQAFDEALASRFQTQTLMGEFQAVKTVVLRRVEHKPATRRFAGKRVRRLT
ncbi:hypothetical protein [Novosphingobium sp.]|uniref:hypothetical protein n=1 Tax=Novosphingobium sp. TaxID=1874826 RepID=UPI002FE28677